MRLNKLNWIAALALTSATCAHALNYSIGWYKVSSGGGTSTGGTFSLSGTIGQADAGTAMTGGAFSLTGGFWSIYAVQAPGAPLLTIHFTNGTAKIFWPSPSPGFVLQHNDDLSTTNWVASPAPDDNGSEKSLTVDSPAGNRFYRLRVP